jgi:hypothetical protein
MKEATPFNPINIPDLTIPASEPQVAKPEVKTSRKKSTPRKPIRTARTRRVLDVPKRAVRITAKIRRQARRLSQRIKGGITSRLAHLDREKLKKVLMACGVVAAAAVAICLLAKLTPLIVALLAVLGLGVVLQMWDRLRTRMPVEL